VQLDRPSGAKVGYGLGLAIVKRVVEWHGGTVEVSQSAAGGASFLIEWPVAQVEPARGSHRSSYRAQAKGA
jgi:signal transduction histidine kinase